MKLRYLLHLWIVQQVEGGKVELGRLLLLFLLLVRLLQVFQDPLPLLGLFVDPVGQPGPLDGRQVVLVLRLGLLTYENSD